jgi:hypothetical protein
MATNPQEAMFRRYLCVLLFCFGAFFGAIWLWVIYEPAAFVKDFSTFNAKMLLIRGGLKNDTVILGDSRPATDLNPSRIGPNVVNLALLGSSPLETYFVTRRILDSGSTPQAVILSISPTHFVDPDPSFWNRSVADGVLNYQEANELLDKARSFNESDVFGGKSPGDIDVRLKIFLYSIKFPSYYSPSILSAGFMGRYAENKRAFDFTLASQGQLYTGQNDEKVDPNFPDKYLPDKDSKLKTFAPARINEFYFDQTLALLASKNIPVYFVDMPHNEASNRIFSDGLKSGFDAFLDSYSKRYPNFRVLDKLFQTYSPDYFVDETHLNQKGAFLWSVHLASVLNDAHVEGSPFGIQ